MIHRTCLANQIEKFTENPNIVGKWFMDTQNYNQICMRSDRQCEHNVVQNFSHSAGNE